MNLNLNNIFSFIKEKKLYLIIVFFVVFLIFSDFSFADGTTAGASSGTNTGGAKTTDLLDSISKGVRWLGTLFSTFLALLTYLTAMFLSPEWMNGKLFNITDKLKEIWILVSNIVYFVFAIILIGIAFMNIVGISADKFQLKQTLPKFIVGILIVPFSWFIVNFILTISALLTISSLTLPFDTFEDYDKALDKVQIPKACTLDFRELSKSGGKNDPNKREKGSKVWECPHEKDKDLISVSKLVGEGTSAKSIFGLVGTYTYGIIGVQGIDKLKKFDLNKIFVAGDIVVKLLFDALFVIVYCILIVALGLVLMVRGIRLWIYMMLSPLFGIMYFLGKNSGGGDGFFGKFNIKEFFALAMVPVYSMLALSFGMLFLYIVGSGLNPNSQDSVLGIQIIPGDNPNETKLTLDKDKGPTLTIKGAASSPNFTGYFTSILGQGFSVIGSLILKIFGVVVLWGAIMAALRSSNITKAIVEPLHSFGKSVGEIAMKSPQYLPIMPGGQSMVGMKAGASQLGSNINSHFTGEGQEFFKQFNPFSDSLATEIRNLAEREKLNTGTSQQLLDNFKKLRKLPIDLGKVLQNGGADKEALIEFLKKQFGDKAGEKFRSANNISKFDQIFKSSEFKKLVETEGGQKLHDKYSSIGISQLIDSGNSSGKSDEKKDDETNSNTANANSKSDKIILTNGGINYNIEVQREEGKDDKEGKIIGIDTTKDANITNLLNGLGIYFKGQSIDIKKSEFINKLKQDENFKEDELNSIADAIDNAGYQFKSEIDKT